MNELRQVDKGVPVNPARWLLAGYAVMALWLYGQILKILPAVVCPLKIFAHVPCPGCGATRACLLTLQGQWRAAFSINPLGFFLACAGGVGLPVIAVLCFLPGPAHRLGIGLKKACGTWAFRVGLMLTVIGTWAWVLHQHFQGAIRY